MVFTQEAVIHIDYNQVTPYWSQFNITMLKLAILQFLTIDLF